VRCLAGALVLACGLAAGGCGDGSGEKSTLARTTTTTTGVVTVSGTYRYPPEVINSFMQTCTQGKKTRQNFCACVIDRLSNSVSNRDFARIARTGRAVPRVEKAIKRATAACAGTSG
jgi:hypothetical protein